MSKPKELTIEDYQQMVADMQTELQEKEAQLSDLTNKVEEKDNTIENLTTDLTKSRDITAQLSLKIANQTFTPKEEDKPKEEEKPSIKLEDMKF